MRHLKQSAKSRVGQPPWTTDSSGSDMSAWEEQVIEPTTNALLTNGCSVSSFFSGILVFLHTSRTWSMAVSAVGLGGLCCYFMVQTSNSLPAVETVWDRDLLLVLPGFRLDAGLHGLFKSIFVTLQRVYLCWGHWEEVWCDSVDVWGWLTVVGL